MHHIHEATGIGSSEWSPVQSLRPSNSIIQIDQETPLDMIKISFRSGGDKIFQERLQGAMTQRRWLLTSAPPVPTPLAAETGMSLNEPLGSAQNSIIRPNSTPVGIAGLERLGLENRKNNEIMIGTAFEDLEALMASAKEIIALAESFAPEIHKDSGEEGSVFSESAALLGLVTTKDKLGSRSDNLYVTELSRNLAEYLTDDRKGVLRSEGGIMSLIDLWAVFNRSRNGVELVSPSDFHKAAQLWEKLGLPVRLRRFKSGLLVVQRSTWNDEKTITQFQNWLEELHGPEQLAKSSQTGQLFGRGIDAHETALKFGWSIGVATEELEMAEDQGALCREDGIEGLRFWRNYLLEADPAASPQSS